MSKKQKESLAGELVKKHWDTGARAILSTIPIVGGALSHLCFDHLDKARIENIERTLNKVKLRISSLGEANLNKSWFESEEALNAIKTLLSTVEVEHQKGKIDLLAASFANLGTNSNSVLENKVGILQRLGLLSEQEIRVFKTFSKLPESEVKVSGGGISRTNKGVSSDNINKKLRLLDINFSQLQVYFDSLQAHNLVNQIPGGYKMTALGRHLSTVL